MLRACNFTGDVDFRCWPSMGRLEGALGIAHLEPLVVFGGRLAFIPGIGIRRVEVAKLPQLASPFPNDTTRADIDGQRQSNKEPNWTVEDRDP